MTSRLHDQTGAIVELLDEAGCSREGDAEDVVVGLALLRQIAGAARGAIGQQETYLTGMLVPGESLQVPGVAQVGLTSTPKKSMNGRRLALVLAARTADVLANDDLEPIPPGRLCEMVAEELVAVFGLDTQSTTARTGELKKRGLKPGEFIDYEDGPQRIAWMDGAA